MMERDGLSRRQFAASAAGLVLAPAALAADAAFDTVIAGGRVMDPESGFDRVAHVGIRGGKVVAITAEPLAGGRRIDARGLVVAPGFIDLHAHGQTPGDSDLQARDGVTTALELEAGVFRVAPFLASRAGKARINHGASVGHRGVRVYMATGIEGAGATDAKRNAAAIAREQEWAYARFDTAKIARMMEIMRSEIAAGGLGIGLMPEYLPATSREEMLALFKTAASLKAPIFVHVRRSVTAKGDGPMGPMEEVIALAAATGAPLHIAHIGSKAVGAIDQALALIHEARARGLDVTTEVYPYTAGSTLIGSALFDEGWQERMGGDYGDIEWALTGERLTAETFAKYRRENPAGWAILHIIPQRTVDTAIADPLVMIASDGVPFINGRGHPRGAGSFARVLWVYVRERKLLSLMEAVAKMTLMPAQRLEGIAPAMRNKGRVKPGADADLTLFDPNKVIDKATFMQPTQPSAGIPYVMVGGELVVDGGAIVPAAAPGKAVRTGA
jgi:N-acyl-D-aspartate/D-glutamate deacylase